MSSFFRDAVLPALLAVVVAGIIMLIGMTIINSYAFNDNGFQKFIEQKNIDCHTCIESHGLNSAVNDSMTMYGLIDKRYGSKLFEDCDFNCTITFEDKL
jgi:hypothetical protein